MKDNKTQEKTDTLFDINDHETNLELLGRGDVSRGVVMNCLVFSSSPYVRAAALSRITEKELLFLILSNVTHKSPSSVSRVTPDIRFPRNTSEEYAAETAALLKKAAIARTWKASRS